jgi:hypothetical protein
VPKLHESKNCPKCNVDRPLDRYYPYHGQCKNCLSVWQADYYRKKPHKRKNGYHLPVGGYDRLFAQQGGQCAICGTDQPGGRYVRLLVDHCHRTGKVRGLLCHGCNAGLGLFKDEPERLVAAAAYLKKSPA